MKRTLKTIIAAILAFVIASSSLSAFAFESGKDLLWDYYSEGVYEKYYYNGELRLGENAVKEENGETFNYYIFNAEKAGLYTFDYDSLIIDFMVTPEYMKKGRAVDIDRALTDYRYENETNYNITMLYLDEGENIIGAYFRAKDTEAVVTVEFMGEEITDIEFEENAFKDLVVDGDIHSMQDGKTHYIYLDAVISFSSGKTLEYEAASLDFTTEEAFLMGNTELYLDFFGYKNKYPANICEITDFVSNVEFYGLDGEVTAVAGYATGHFFLPSSEGYKVTYTDGSSKVVEQEYGWTKITLKNDRSYHVNALPKFDYDSEKYYYTISVAEHDYEKIEIKVEKISFTEDLYYFKDMMGRMFSNYGAELGGAFNNVHDNSFSAYDFFVNVFRFMSILLIDGTKLIGDFAEASAGLIKFHLTK